MKKIFAARLIYITFFSVLTLVLLSGCNKGSTETSPAKKLDSQLIPQPNIVLILTDDQGYGDLGFNGNTELSTPTLDDLFSQGVSFDRFYVSPVCAPTRASLLTGKHYLKTGVFHVTRGGEKMKPLLNTLPERLKQNGYMTGLFGKWHNGLQYPHDPIGQGFDEFYGFSAGHLSEYFNNYLHHNNKKVKYQGYVADAITDKTIAFINQINQKTDQPFFAMLSFNTPHGPFQSPQALFEKYKAQGQSDLNASIYAMMENIDNNVAKVIDALEKSGELSNTIILYTSDNGPAFPKGLTRYNAGLKGHKGIVDEGGVRAPLTIFWPDGDLATHKVLPITQHIDITPTLLSLLKISYEADEFDGRDLSPLMRKNDTPWQERYLYTHRFRIAKDSSKNPIHPTPAAIRSQQYLAMAGENKQWQLYDLIADPGQQNDLANTKPEILADYKAKFATWYEKTIAEYGPYKTMPIEIGHASNKIVRFPAHEALIEENAEYQHGAGWSHDWIVPSVNANGSAYWPIKITNEGKYKITVSYATPKTGYDGKLSINAQGQSVESAGINSFVPKQLSSSRQFYTDEAPDLTWATLELGQLTLSPGLSNLQIMFNKDVSKREIWIKEVTLEML